MIKEPLKKSRIAAARLGASFAALMFVAGCSLIPEFKRPAAPVPEKFAGASDTAASNVPAWREYFTDPALRTLIEAALNNNRDMKIALARELDDEDGVLGGQADDGDQSDLEEHIVGQTAQVYGQHGPEDAQRHYQDHRKGNGPALVQRCQGEKHHQQRQGEEDGRLGSGKPFLERGARPCEAETWR